MKKLKIVNYKRFLISWLIVILVFSGVSYAIFGKNKNKDSNETKKENIEETVKDETKIKINLKESKNNKIKLEDKFKEPGYTAIDEKGNDISNLVEVKNTQIKEAGKHVIEYIVNYENVEAKETREIEVLQNKKYKTKGIAVCMYHYVYDEKNPPAKLNANYISTKKLEAQLEYLTKNQYYFPTWEELRKYIDGKLILPEKSVVLTFDDGASNFLELGIPLIEKYKVPATSFVITSKDGEEKVKKYKSEYVSFQSHSHNMHRAGGKIGHGGIFTALSVNEGVNDLKKSIEICENGEAFAYPYGDYNQTCTEAVKKAGFICAFTTKYGKVYPGSNPLLLPRVRILKDMTLNSFEKSL